jgi:putative ABC transport system permease protein
VRQTVHRLDPALPVANLEPLAATLSHATARPRFLALLVGLFAAVALLLAAVGTYGVLSYGVEQRRHEMGVRLALGAQARNLLGLVLAQGMGLAALGLVLGLVGAFALRRLLASQLYGVDAADPATFLGVTALLAVVALAACALPAHRATRVDPMETLRVE